MPSVFITQVVLTGGIDRVLQADSLRFAIIPFGYLSGQFFFGPLSSMLGGGGMFGANPDCTLRITRRKFGDLLTQEWYASGSLGSVVNFVEIYL